MSHSYAVTRVLGLYNDLTPSQAKERLRRSTFVNLEKRFMYFEVPKAACTSMKQLLNRLEGAPPIALFTGGQQETRRDMFVHVRENSPLPSLVDLGDDQQREVLESSDFLRMTVVRNPYTRLFSAWRNKVMLCEPRFEHVHVAIKGRLPDLQTKSLVTFAEFVDYVSKEDLRVCDPHWLRQVDHTFFDAMNFTLVGKVEHMADTLGTFSRHLGLADGLMAEARNVSNASHTFGYDADLADRVYALYRRDFEVLDYRRDDWPAAAPPPGPRMVREDTFNDEIVERNLILAHLYRELDQVKYHELAAARSELQKVQRFHLLTLANAVLTVGEICRKWFGPQGGKPPVALRRH